MSIIHKLFSVESNSVLLFPGKMIAGDKGPGPYCVIIYF